MHSHGNRGNEESFRFWWCIVVNVEEGWTLVCIPTYNVGTRKKENVKTLLEQLAFYKKAHKHDREYQVWQEGIQPKLIQNDVMMKDKIDYIHNNPVKRGYVDDGKHWHYSSARDYEGLQGLLDVELLW